MPAAFVTVTFWRPEAEAVSLHEYVYGYGGAGSGAEAPPEDVGDATEPAPGAAAGAGVAAVARRDRHRAGRVEPVRVADRAAARGGAVDRDVAHGGRRVAGGVPGDDAQGAVAVRVERPRRAERGGRVGSQRGPGA